MSGSGTVGARFKDGSIAHARVPANRFFDIMLYPEIFDADDIPAKRFLSAAGRVAQEVQMCPTGQGLLFVDFRQRRVLCHIPYLSGLNTFFATKVLDSAFVGRAADLGHARLSSRSGDRGSLSRQHLEGAKALIQNPRAGGEVAGLHRVEWLTADVVVHLVGWDIVHRPQTTAGLADLARDLADVGCQIDTQHPDWESWVLDIPDAA